MAASAQPPCSVAMLWPGRRRVLEGGGGDLGGGGRGGGDEGGGGPSASRIRTQQRSPSTRSLTPRRALFRSSRPPHCSPGTPGSPGWDSGLSRGGEKLGFGRGSAVGGRAPPGDPLPHGTFGGCGLGHPRREVGARLRSPGGAGPRAAAPQDEVVPAAPGPGAAAAAAGAGGALREPPRGRGRASPRRRAARLFFSSREDAAVTRR